MANTRRAKKPTEADWIAMRMLYLVLCGDGSAALIRDVAKTIDYYRFKLGDNFYPSMELIVSEHARLKTFENPASDLARRLDKSIKYQPELEWPSATPLYDAKGTQLPWISLRNL